MNDTCVSEHPETGGLHCSLTDGHPGPHHNLPTDRTWREEWPICGAEQPGLEGYPCVRTQGHAGGHSDSDGEWSTAGRAYDIAAAELAAWRSARHAANLLKNAKRYARALRDERDCALARTDELAGELARLRDAAATGRDAAVLEVNALTELGYDEARAVATAVATLATFLKKHS